MNEPEQHLSPESIDHQTERVFSALPTPDNRLIAVLYQFYAPAAEENNRSLQRIWSRFAQVQEQYLLQDREQPGSAPIIQDKTGNHDAPIPGSFHRPPQPLRRDVHRSLWRRFSGVMAVAVVLLIILSWALLTHPFSMQNPQTTTGASLMPGGGPQPNNDIVFLVKSSDPNQYLATISYETYDGHGWSNAVLSRSPLPAGKRTVSESPLVHLITQQITVVNPPGELQPYIPAAEQIASVNQPATVLLNKSTSSQIAVLLNNNLVAGKHYIIQSYVSTASIAQLRTIPLPAQSPGLPSNYTGQPPLTYYNPAILSAYLQLPPNLDPRILTKARQVTANAKSMYDMAVDLEDYLRTNFTYSVTVQAPPGVEPTAWLLFHSNHSAYCNYFASAMAVMARELGMPSRVVIGYTNGTYDPKAQLSTVRASDAHAWTQIYFASYGWINFEPSPSFSSFVHPLPTNGGIVPTP